MGICCRKITFRPCLLNFAILHLSSLVLQFCRCWQCKFSCQMIRIGLADVHNNCNQQVEKKKNAITLLADQATDVAAMYLILGTAYPNPTHFSLVNQDLNFWVYKFALVYHSSLTVAATEYLISLAYAN
ncbi:hypothetical protein ACLB2K_016080 [Fragaria x ananassa]